MIADPLNYLYKFYYFTVLLKGNFVLTFCFSYFDNQQNLFSNFIFKKEN